MVEPIKMGCWAYGRVFGGGLWILSVGYLEDNKGLKPVEGVSAWLEHRIRRDGRNGFTRLENAQCGTGSAGFYLGRFKAKGIFLVCGC
ncbi:hypothetical protein CIK88_06900 [Prevotella sp. P5-50]|nr:hypothetical protein CIK88_06900 [Prevotella sp. P5-50]